jgi:hypothetical protein
MGFDIVGSENTETYGWPISTEYPVMGTIYLKPNFSNKL